MVDSRPESRRSGTDRSVTPNGTENTAKSASRGRRFLDLSFTESRERDGGKVLANGRRPHGGVRGTKGFPMSSYSVDQTEEHMDELAQEARKQSALGPHARTPSPAWVLEVRSQQTHSGEAALLTSQLLASNKGEQTVGVKPKKPKFKKIVVNGLTYHRPMKAHQFLTAADTASETSSEASSLGRPTRASLLRARHHRSQSAPSSQTSTDIKRYLQRMKDTRPLTGKLPKELNPIVAEDGETVHAFLIGARYNRSQVMDVQSLNRFGLFVPRANPNGCFLTQPELHVTEKDAEDAADNTSVKNNPPQYNGRGNPPTKARQAWADSNGAVPQQETLPPGATPPKGRPPSGRKRTGSIGGVLADNTIPPSLRRGMAITGHSIGITSPRTLTSGSASRPGTQTPRTNPASRMSVHTGKSGYTHAATCPQSGTMKTTDPLTSSPNGPMARPTNISFSANGHKALPSPESQRQMEIPAPTPEPELPDQQVPRNSAPSVRVPLPTARTVSSGKKCDSSTQYSVVHSETVDLESLAQGRESNMDVYPSVAEEVEEMDTG
ncbi:protein PRRC2A-like isoform X1 [Branchiostoma lanceolatum]|uniref:protein PRRC2A-like isoform X1 n=1 Tax=Branchiostoma lanceolatum TaxID=7740 RepID=UPI003455F0D9